MDALIVARESAGVSPTKAEVADPADALALVAKLPHGPQLASLFARQALGVVILAESLDRQAARAAIGVAVQRSKPRGIVLLGPVLSRELLGEGLPLQGGLREMHGKVCVALGRAREPEVEKLLADFCQRAHISWAPPSARAASTRTVVRAEDAAAQAALFIEKQEWQKAVDTLRAAEPLGPKGTNMLGRALLMLGDKAGARHAFERTLQADPSNGIAQRQLGNL